MYYLLLCVFEVFRYRGIPNYVKGTVDAIVDIHKREQVGDILAFLTGMDEVSMQIKIYHFLRVPAVSISHLILGVYRFPKYIVL